MILTECLNKDQPSLLDISDPPVAPLSLDTNSCSQAAIPIQPNNGKSLVKQSSSVIDNLLTEIYDKWHYKSRHDSNWDSDTTMTSASDGTMMTSAIHTAVTRSDGSRLSGFSWNKQLGSICLIGDDGEQTPWQPINEHSLANKSMSELATICEQLRQMITVFNTMLVRQLKRRDHAFIRMQKNCDILTAILQASSMKRREDTKLKFVMEPKPGNEAFKQWCDAMRGVVRLPLGLPAEIRKKVWLSLANHHISVQKYDWSRVLKFAFNERSNPDDDALGLQIVKDLHRTGCDTFTTEAERAVLKRVLLAYARWNKRVGYCQGFNVLAAIILEVMQRNEDNSLKVMVYLVDHILPESYFAQNLQALSIDMAVFRELLNTYVPKLAAHLNYLQTKSQRQNCYGNTQHYEPPLTNVFTMQWFLTLFATCLPPSLVLRIWDSIMLEGSEIILRTGLVIWESLSDRLLKVKDADTFYCTMRELTTDLFDGKIIQAEQLVHRVYTIAPMPFTCLSNLRDRFTYNINPFSSSIPAAVVSYADNDIVEEDDEEEEYNKTNNKKSGVGCFSAIGNSPNSSISHSKSSEGLSNDSGHLSLSTNDISQVGPGAVSKPPSHSPGSCETDSVQIVGATQERMSTDLPALESQYRRIKTKQRFTSLRISSVAEAIPSQFPQSATLINHSQFRRFSSANSQLHLANRNKQSNGSVSSAIVVNTTAYPSPQHNTMVNHLFLPSQSSMASSSLGVRNRVLLRQHRIKSSATSETTSSSRDQHPPCVTTIPKKSVLSTSTVSSSIQPRSDSSTVSFNHKPARSHRSKSRRLSISGSDIAGTINDDDDIDSDYFMDEDGVNAAGKYAFRRCRSASLSDLSADSRIQPPTLLQLCKVSHANELLNNKLSALESPSSQLLPTPDLNSVLERHHKRIQNGAVEPFKVASPNHKFTKLPLDVKHKTPTKLLLNEDNQPNEIGNTARWVVEHHLQYYNTDASTAPAKSISGGSTNSKPYQSLFGSKTGLYHTLAHNRASRYKDNNLLRSVYSSIETAHK